MYPRWASCPPTTSSVGAVLCFVGRFGKSRPRTNLSMVGQAQFSIPGAARANEHRFGGEITIRRPEVQVSQHPPHKGTGLAWGLP